jgi:GxxExxY protein
MDVFEFRERSGSLVDPETEEIATRVIGAVIEVHKELGPGMPERSYLLALSHELTLREIPHLIEFVVPVTYKGREVGVGRVDILVANRLVLELKCVEAIAPVHKAQALTYLRLLKLELALVVNFNVERVKDGIKRVVHKP